VGTQADKMPIALDVFGNLLQNMPDAEKQFQLSKENVLNNMRSQRLVKSDIFWSYLYWKNLGIDYDVRKPIFEKINTMELKDVRQFFDEHVKPAHYSVLIIGKKGNTDFNYLKKYGEIKEFSLKELFGY
jgi:predicted Zn-dependent peptidase